MRNHETAMLAYARLARLSHDRKQPVGRDRFLVLTGREACFSGWIDVAARCRELVLANNPQHLLSHDATFPEALREPDNGKFFAKLEAFCPFEQAEHLLHASDDWPELSDNQTAGEFAFAQLSVMAIPNDSARGQGDR